MESTGYLYPYRNPHNEGQMLGEGDGSITVWIPARNIRRHVNSPG